MSLVKTIKLFSFININSTRRELLQWVAFLLTGKIFALGGHAFTKMPQNGLYYKPINFILVTNSEVKYRDEVLQQIQ